ncbi:Methionine--tRNA ligase, mitochondrial [Marasmius tenuissimus]|uniref:Methionine--tRNA ligase, mitochondrial n=1 Tax=Marasmius tenuissimus TaxID=585030 RepID=A0ABR2ZS92_9AGAR
MTPQECIDYVFGAGRSMPSPTALEMLWNECGQKWLDGEKVIVDACTKVVLPLWCLNLWRKVSMIIKIQDDWKDAHTTLTRVVQDPVISSQFSSPESVLGRRSWNGDVTVGKFVLDTHTFSGLLHPQMLNDDVTQAMVQYLQCHLEMDTTGCKKQHYIAASHFATVLRTAAAGKHQYKNNKLPKTLRVIESDVRENPCLKVWFLALLNKHEIAFCIDFEERTLAYGDSLVNMPHPHQGAFKDLRNQLVHGEQQDCVSCIPVTMNTIAHGVFGKDIWCHEKCFLDHIRWFQNIVPDWVEEVLGSVTPQTTADLGWVRLSLADLLNLVEEMAWDDIVTSTMEELQDPVVTQLLAVEPDAKSTLEHTVKPAPSSLSSSNINHNTTALDNPNPSSHPRPPSPTPSIKSKLKDGWGAIFGSKKAVPVGNTSRKKRAAESESKALEDRKKKAKADDDRLSTSGAVGISKAAQSELASHACAEAGEFDPVKREKWKKKI